VERDDLVITTRELVARLEEYRLGEYADPSQGEVNARMYAISISENWEEMKLQYQNNVIERARTYLQGMTRKGFLEKIGKKRCPLTNKMTGTWRIKTRQ